MKSAEDVAKIIINCIQDRINELMSQENPVPRECIYIGVHVREKELQELSDDPNIPDAFKEEVADFITHHGPNMESFVESSISVWKGIYVKEKNHSHRISSLKRIRY